LSAQIDPDEVLGRMCNGALIGFNFDLPSIVLRILEPVRRARTDGTIC
jgi:hypothetical protein